MAETLRRWVRWGRLLVVLSLPVGAFAEMPPIELFAKAAETRAVRISPQGDYLGVIRTVQVQYKGEEIDKDVLVIFKFPSMQHSATLSFPKRASIGTFYWANDERVIATVTESNDRVSWEYGTGELYAMNADGSARELIFGYRAGVYGGHDILNLLWDQPEEILIARYRSRYRAEADVAAYRLNVYDGNLRRVARAPTRNAGLMADGKGRLSYAFALSDDFERVVYQFDANEKSWRERSRTPFGGSGSDPISVAKDGHVYVAEAEDEGPLGIYRLNVASGTKELVYRHAYADAQLLIDSDARVWGASVWSGYSEFVPLDLEHPYAQVVLSLQEMFPGLRVGVVDATRDLRFVLISISGAHHPAQYYLLDRSSDETRLQLLLNSLPWLEGVALAATQPIEFTARDGLKIRGYLTLPRSDAGWPQTKLPLVVVPHGGPFGVRDTWRYDPDIQLLASRGYAVLQMNFRGSGGYGPHFESLGIGERGFKMQDDVTDATRWAIDAGYADADRICIYGWSHGGYAALRGAVKEPGLYRCVIGAAGVYDFEIQYQQADYTRYRFGKAYMRQSLGRDKAVLREISPARHADKITAPVFLVHGRRDWRVPIEHAKAMRKALVKVGNTPEYMEKRTEGHGFYNESNRVELYAAVLDFLNRHIGQGAPALD